MKLELGRRKIENISLFKLRDRKFPGMISSEEAQIIYDACKRHSPDDYSFYSYKVLGESETHVRVQVVYKHKHRTSLTKVKSFDIEVAAGGV
jgi:hypothetical protein